MHNAIPQKWVKQFNCSWTLVDGAYNGDKEICMLLHKVFDQTTF